MEVVRIRILAPLFLPLSLPGHPGPAGEILTVASLQSQDLPVRLEMGPSWGELAPYHHTPL